MTSMGVRSFTILSLLGMLFLSIYTHFNNTESYFNYLNQHTSVARDYDRDGDSEAHQGHEVEMVKISQLVLMPLYPEIKIHIPMTFEKVDIPVESDPNVASDNILSVFRPPIAA